MSWRRRYISREIKITLEIWHKLLLLPLHPLPLSQSSKVFAQANSGRRGGRRSRCLLAPKYHPSNIEYICSLICLPAHCGPKPKHPLSFPQPVQPGFVSFGAILQLSAGSSRNPWVFLKLGKKNRFRLSCSQPASLVGYALSQRHQDQHALLASQLFLSRSAGVWGDRSTCSQFQGQCFIANDFVMYFLCMHASERIQNRDTHEQHAYGLRTKQGVCG